MRRLLVAGNWKMNLTASGARQLAEGLVRDASGLEGLDLAVFPPAPYLGAVAETLGGSAIRWGGQDHHWENEGAFTGAVSAPMLRELGCTGVLVGHSERRHVFGETDGETNKKVHSALNHRLEPILCIGETLEERETGRTEEVLSRQLSAGLAGVGAEELTRVTLAYEPVWAIGTGRTATPEIAQEAHAFLRRTIAETVDPNRADAIRILYGGSVRADNAALLLGLPDVDGALVGGASLDAASFLAIAQNSLLPDWREKP